MGKKVDVTSVGPSDQIVLMEAQVFQIHCGNIFDGNYLNVFKKPVGCPFASFFRPILKKKGRPIECRHRPS